MLSQKCKYAIRAVIYLASQNGQQKLVRGTEIAESLVMPTAFTVKILQELAKKNVILSVKGPKGGFYLSEECKNLPILRIVEAIDDLQFFHNCGIGLSKCSDTHPCPFHSTFKEIRDLLFQTLSTKNIGDFCEDINHDLYFLTDDKGSC